MPTTSTSTSTTSARPIVNQASRSERRPVLTTSTGSLGRFRVTCYGPPQFTAGKHTATGAPVGPGSLAVDPGVIRLGTALTLVGIGDVVADDTGGMVGGHHVDLWRPSCAGWANPTVEIIRR
jgi:3D (Asp-Asp-Asp) domain-containing protein